MRHFRKWQSGAADIVSIAVAMTILSVVVAGTSAAMVFGREAMIRQEHAKVAAYMLRGKMEEIQGAVTTVNQAIDPHNTRNLFNAPETYPSDTLDLLSDRAGNVEPVYVTMTRDRLIYPSYDDSAVVKVGVTARWQERDLAAGNPFRVGRQDRSLKFVTAMVIRGRL